MSPVEDALEGLCRLAAHLCKAPVALISLTGEPQRFTAQVGQAVPYDRSLCEAAVAAAPGVLVVPDAAADARFAASPWVTSEPRLRFWAGAPLVTAEGQIRGALCVLDRAPRGLSAQEARSLAALARQAVLALELRETVDDLRRAASERDIAEAALAEREAVLRSFYDNAPMLMGVVEIVEGDILHISANAAVGTYNARDPRAMANKRSSQLGNARKDIDAWIARYLEAHRQKSPLTFEYLHESPLGARWLSALLTPLPSAPGGPPRLSYIIEDVTVRKRMTDALLESEERLALALDSAQEGLWEWDVEADKYAVCERWARVLGHDPSELAGPISYANSLIHPEDRERSVAQARAHLAGQAPRIECEMRVRTRAGGYKWLLFLGKIARRDEGGKPLLMVGTFRDMTERRELLARLAEARDKALAASVEKSAFLANMSHELRTPLNAILAYSELVDEEAMAAGATELRADIASIQRAASHLLGLINRILDFSKIEAGKLTLRSEPFELHEVVGEVAAAAQPQMDRNQNRLEVRLQPPRVAMCGDRARLSQCLLYLLDNAAKFTHEGEVFLDVERYEEPPGEVWVRIEVRDTGVGMKPEQMAGLFQAGAEALPKTDLHSGGIGLGLPITERLCRLMGGRIHARSELGGGSVLTLELPAELSSEGPVSIGSFRDAHNKER